MPANVPANQAEFNAGSKPVWARSVLAAAGLAIALAVPSVAQPAGGPGSPEGGAAKAPEFPPFEKVIEGMTKVVSIADGTPPLYDLYKDEKTGRLLAVLPDGYAQQLLMIACTVTAGDPEAGVMGPTHYVKWERYDKQLALVAPDFSVATSGDTEAKDSVKQLFTGRVLTTTPIIAMSGGRPVIDLATMATRDVPKFFGSSVYGGYGPDLPAVNPSLTRLTKTKAFPKNVVVEFQAPRPDGQLVRFAYSIGELSGTPGFKPRKADPKFGYFYNYHEDFAKTASKEVTDRYINRWSVEKASPNLKMSPPKQPIVWYIESTTPVRFRRYVREGILLWNQAFAEIGVDSAVVVYQQDAQTGAHMDKDPEDSRYNFFRWNVSDLGYAIGPSRTNPQTGEILNAGVVWHQGLTRAVRGMLDNFSIALTEHAFGPEALAWLDSHPTWDPRLRLASPAQREANSKLHAEHGTPSDAASAHAAWSSAAMGGGGCKIGELLALDMSLADAAFAAGVITPSSPDQLDDLPEEFVGQMIRYISAHEVGHCMGLQHNMIASNIHTLKEINTPGFSGPTIGSVMDYAAANINYKLGDVQGPYATPTVGPYDRWVIAYGYGPEEQLDELRKKAGEPQLIYQSQAAISIDSDPRNNTWDLGADNLQFAESRLGLIQDVRGKLLDKVVKDGESWSVARKRWQSLMGGQLQMLSIASRWVGGSFLNNDAKGDPGNRTPVQDIPAESQRRALKLIMDNAFEDNAYGLTPDIIRHLGKQHFYDPQAIGEIIQDASYTVHDSVGGAQGFALSMLMNSTTLRRLYDNEFRTADADNPITMAEVVRAITDNAWREYKSPAGSYSPAKPMTSSLRRNLQREHLERLITLSLLTDVNSASLRAISTIARAELKRVDELAAKGVGATPDPYTKAHLDDARVRIAKAIDAAYVITR